MGVPRAAGLLVGLGLFALTAPAMSQEPPAPRDPIAAAPGAPGGGLDLPLPPEATVSLELPAETAQASPTEADTAQASPVLASPAPASPAPASPAPAADGVAQAVAARLADAAIQLHPRLPKKERESLASFYAQRAFKPVWIEARTWTPAAEGVIARLKEAAEDGLDAADYPVPAIGVVARGDSEADLAEAELKLAASAVMYARDARGARVDLSHLSTLITPKLELPGAAAVLARLADMADGPAARGTDAALEAYNPAHAGYRALKAKLAELRASRPTGTPMVRVPQGPALKVGMRDPRVPLIRTRFKLGPASQGETARDETAYDERTASAVADFQREKGLVPNGVLTRQTIAALSGPSPARIEGDIIANMERWRWLPSDMGTRHIAVNIPEFRLRIMDGASVVHQARVVVGKPETPTPVFSGVMEYAIVNPSWNVPPSILKKEFLPQMALDPFYAEKKGYEVIRRGNSITVRQPPGERNALGFIKFMFPNQHAVYLHDTPSRTLFRNERRAFSHGCVRVDQPFLLADQVLGKAWTEARLKSLIGRGERTINLPQHLSVHLTYFTTIVDEGGTLRTLEDLYGHNRRVRAALGLDG